QGYEELMMISAGGIVIRTPLENISERLGRATSGVILMNLREGDRLAAIAILEPSANGNGDDDGANGSAELSDVSAIDEEALAALFRDEPAVPVPPEDNVYVRFAGYALVGSALAPLIGAYASFVLINVLFWVAAAVATYLLALRFTQHQLTAVLATLLVSTAP